MDGYGGTKLPSRHPGLTAAIHDAPRASPRGWIRQHHVALATSRTHSCDSRCADRTSAEGDTEWTDSATPRGPPKDSCDSRASLPGPKQSSKKSGRVRVFRNPSFLTLLTAIVLSASLALLNSPSTSAETPAQEEPNYTVDGISLGMSESEVRALWGELEQRSDGKIRRFVKSGEDLIPPLAHLVTLDEDGRVVAVQGRRLKLEGKLVLACGQEWSGMEDSLGEPTRSNLFGCGNPGPLQTERRARGDLIFEATSWNLDFFELPPGMTRKQALEENPELKGVQSVSIHTRDFYYRNSKTR